ncbi:uncharacterized protein BYT42DRAFT_584570 [Radiomyces spectabilis]|uniref:uncharacterized protein n=1 Tax=Radiomyces spectabilis TaxID=64574 RepID=UPI00221F5996|nr:uncharacterized protein BYT42DRAFT_584570 [Radiomyces spectabilis]KAI8369468.1 hypothetical protein BYT42DRAFT_584570 [Radiomyces spectabilis]
MVFRTTRSIRRYIVMLAVVSVLFYMSARHMWTSDGSIELAYTESDILADAILLGSSKEMRIKHVNQKYCGRDVCRFTLPLVITEQESKAQEHFRQIAFLSGKLDRTIVLPNVHTSHLGACRRYPFEFYYSHSWLDNNSRFFSYITMEDFRAWISERHEIEAIPTARELFVESQPETHLLQKNDNCFRPLFTFEQSAKQFQLDDPENQNRREGNYTEILFNALSDDLPTDNSNSTITGPEVLHLYYDRRFGFIEEPEVNVPLAYSAKWEGLADDIADQLKPFVAVHWRMERLEPLSNLQPCAETLVEKLANIDVTGKPNVFLLTDYPHLLQTSQSAPESMSFKLEQLQQEHHDAIRYLYKHVNVTLTTLDRVNQLLPYDELPRENWNIIPVSPYVQPPDPSILGIVDKLVAMRAQWFLAGEPGKCGKTSSFTRRIILHRQDAYHNGDENIIVPFDYFNVS